MLIFCDYNSKELILVNDRYFTYISQLMLVNDRYFTFLKILEYFLKGAKMHNLGFGLREFEAVVCYWFIYFVEAQLSFYDKVVLIENAVNCMIQAFNSVVYFYSEENNR